MFVSGNVSYYYKWAIECVYGNNYYTSPHKDNNKL